MNYKKNNLHEKIIGPAVAVDTVVLAIEKERLRVLLIKIGAGPYINKWAVPGGLVQLGEDIEKTALRVLKQKTNIEENHLEQLFTFGKAGRDVRGEVVSIAYLLLLSNVEKYGLKTDNVYSDIAWFEVDNLPQMAFDHKEMVKLAKERLRSKLHYSNIAYSLLDKSFTLGEMQKVYETVWGKKIDKRNFRKKIDKLKIIEKTGKIKRGKNRPAKTYRFLKRELSYFD